MTKGWMVLLILALLPAVQGVSEGITCTDSDGGVEVFTFGSVEFLETYEDYCYDDVLLREYYCNDEGHLDFEWRECATGCYLGRCGTEDVCGDLVCGKSERCSTCPGDCGPCYEAHAETRCVGGDAYWFDGKAVQQKLPQECEPLDRCVEGACQPKVVCGDEVCDLEENAQTCPADCPSEATGMRSGLVTLTLIIILLVVIGAWYRITTRHQKRR